MIHKLLRKVLAAFCLMVMPCAVADDARLIVSNVRGTATLTRGALTTPCEEIFLVPIVDNDGAADATQKLQMDWVFYHHLRELRAAAVTATHCRADGSFEFHNIAASKMVVVAHFSWLRGKWSTGGSLIRRINVPLISPLYLRSHLND